MTSDTEDKLDEINRKLQIMIENSYLAKLDLMFSVLVSFTIFCATLLLTSFSLERNILFITLEAFYPVLVYTLIGEAYSILKDDVVTRFGFWLVLISNSIFIILLVFTASLLSFLGSLSIFILLPVNYIFILAVIIGFNKYTDFFWRFIQRFPTKFPSPREIYSREMRRLLKPMMIGVFIYLIAFLSIGLYVFLVPT